MWWSRLVLAVFILGLAACGGKGTRTAEGVFLPVHGERGTGPAAELGGTLHEEAGCLFAATSAGRRLVIWPAGYSYEDGRLSDVTGTVVAMNGEPFTTGGGEVREPVALELIGGDEIPEECRTNPYWMSTGVLPPDYPNNASAAS